MTYKQEDVTERNCEFLRFLKAELDIQYEYDIQRLMDCVNNHEKLVAMVEESVDYLTFLKGCYTRGELEYKDFEPSERVIKLLNEIKSEKGER